MSDFNAKAASLLCDLPDAAEAERFLSSLTVEHKPVCRLLERDAGLLADALALVAWSPFLATTLRQHPEHLQWLARVRLEARVRSTEELGESLARFAATNTSLAPAVLLARFRRRELLRIYLRDIRHTATLVETTEELSNLADAALAFALDLARQELDNLYGAPLCTDARGRTSTAGFCIVALGKLGSRELNYASDIDLLYLYSDDGATAGTGTRGTTTNREYFIRLANRISAIIGATSQAGGEGAAYRVDLRLRPHGRDGALAPSVTEAVRYYCERAQRWELQALIRARAAAGTANLFERFHVQVRDTIFRQGETVASALEHVRLGKRKIDEQHGGGRAGFNVKLGRGGIREIEFIAQALQLAYGGEDEWLRTAHTLVSLGRLADRRLITDSEYAQLSDAYTFLRRVEHRAQMEHGLQTHVVPDDDARRALLARRLDFNGTDDDARNAFDATLQLHCTNVREIYARIFNAPPESSLDENATRDATDEVNAVSPSPVDKARHLQVKESAPDEQLALLALDFSRHLTLATGDAANEPGGARDAAERAREILVAALPASLNERRARACLVRVAASLAKVETPVVFTPHQLRELVRVCGASEPFGDMLANNPPLVSALPASNTVETDDEFSDTCQSGFAFAADGALTFAGALAALRHAHAALLIRIVAADIAGRIDSRSANCRQTLLAATSLDAAYKIAARELSARHHAGAPLAAMPRLAVLGLGRFGGGGMDYGSDLDLVLVFDDATPSPLPHLTHETAYTLFAEILVAALSSFTRDGYLYRVDLRLRPDGKNGAVVTSRTAFASYLRDRAAAWELLAYIKLHPSAGDRKLGSEVLTDAHAAMREAVRRPGGDAIRAETRRVRDRLAHERAARRGAQTLDIKFDAGGMLDVYFAARFLQLRDGIREDTADDRTTTATLARLRAAGSLSIEDHDAMRDGYALLRRLDHSLRIIAGRGTRLPPLGSPALEDLARCLEYASVPALLEDLREWMAAVRAAFERITA